MSPLAVFLIGVGTGAACLVLVGCALLAGRREYPAPPEPRRTPIRFACECPVCARAAERIEIADRLDDVERDEHSKAGA